MCVSMYVRMYVFMYKGMMYGCVYARLCACDGGRVNIDIKSESESSMYV
jgi:hypothetical protein